ncbi:hypothetical protein I4U23_003596 [Adineta vaga]|nr:hypothetical protein I4U23_003596 [Adineta vaga]
MSEFEQNAKLNNIELFQVYIKMCQRLTQAYGMYVFSTGFGYFGKSIEGDDFLKFNILVHPRSLTTISNETKQQVLPRDKHQDKVIEIIRSVATEVLQYK